MPPYHWPRTMEDILGILPIFSCRTMTPAIQKHSILFTPCEEDHTVSLKDDIHKSYPSKGPIRKFITDPSFMTMEPWAAD